MYLASPRDTLKVRTMPQERTVLIPVDSLTRVERYRRIPWTARALEGAKWGAMTGAAVGTLDIVMSERGPGDPPQAWWPLIGLAYGAVPTAVIFAVVPAHEWTVVPLSGSRQVHLRPLPTGVAVRVTW